MAKTRCQHCGKGSLYGKKIARARQGLNYRSPKVFKVNLHSLKIEVNGRKKKLTLCTKCLRKVKKDWQERKKKQELLKTRAEVKKKPSKGRSSSGRKGVGKLKKTVKKERVSRKEAREKRKKEKEEKEKKKTVPLNES
ncbi:MAG TPA: L28 family ribosomal protein [Candidatus Bathyarchaeia archaeon]|nr:L28 family ribosomal protein [Candidatus Bathyarchaeia archaeon]